MKTFFFLLHVFLIPSNSATDQQLSAPRFILCRLCTEAGCFSATRMSRLNLGNRSFKFPPNEPMRLKDYEKVVFVAVFKPQHPSR